MSRSRIGVMQNIAPASPRADALAHPSQLGVSEWDAYALVIDARSPHEFDDDHVPGAQNLPVVDDEQYAEVGTAHRTDPHAAYLAGVEYSLRNIARHIRTLITRFDPDSRMLVYCFRGGKRSKLWADNLRTIGYRVDVLEGGWKRYRLWVRESLDALPARFELKVLAGATGCGKTRLLHALRAAGEQVLDLEALASHRGSLIGAIPGERQPSQKLFDSQVLEALRRMDPQRPIWLEAESRKIGNLHLPAALHEAMHRSVPIRLVAPMSERVKLWREDYAHFARDPASMVHLLAPLKPLIGGGELARWQALAAAGEVDTLFERVMTAHYDPCYDRSTKGSYGKLSEGAVIELQSLDAQALLQVARDLVE
jgi:tRNA 2-selenouridine synthase